MTAPPRIHLFQGYGVELEYMLVDKDTLAVKPISDELLKSVLGAYGSDFENGIITWSNELVMHVIELKSTRPEADFVSLEKGFVDNVSKVNAILASHHAMLMPTAAHPFMNPMDETKLWPHDSNDVYEIYNRIFDCKGHGWSNLQSTHINLPFYDDEEFAKLHAAVRLVLPILPAICASSPMLDGKLTGVLDTRLTYYKTNQARIPSITGRVIPEAIFSKRNYLNTIYDKIKSDIAPFNTGNVLNPIWVNSRGAIPRFDRGSIEIRIMDIQECPAADISIVVWVVEMIKALVNEEWISFEDQMKWETRSLMALYDQTIVTGLNTQVNNSDYLKVFGIDQTQMTVMDLSRRILDQIGLDGQWKNHISFILSAGSLSERILASLGDDVSHDAILRVYKRLAHCLAENKLFTP